MKKKAATQKEPGKGTPPSKRKLVFPRGWDAKRVQDVIDYCDKQTEDEELAEYEDAMKVEGLSVMLVPTELVPEIRRLIGRRRGA